MALDFPSSPTNGQLFYPLGGPVWVYDSTVGGWKRNAGTALPMNKLINPAMQISQENGDTISTLGQYWAADQWKYSGGSNPIGRVASTTPRGSKYRIRLNTTTAGPAADISIEQIIEGNRLADLKWGTAGAIPAVFRFGARGPIGTYSACLHAPGWLRSIHFPITFTQANVDTEFVFPVPSCTDGVWPTDNTEGMKLRFWLSVVSTPQATQTGVWITSASGIYALSGQNNIRDTVGNTFELFDVGLYADPYRTGVAPEFQASPIEDDLQDCLRYWYKLHRATGEVSGVSAGFRLASTHPTSMRVAPSATLVGISFRAYDGTAAPNMASISQNLSNIQSAEFSITTATSTMVAARACDLIWDSGSGDTTNYITMSARM